MPKPASPAPTRPRKRPIKWYGRLLERLAATRLGAWFFVRIAPAIDRRVVRLSRGRLSLALVRPVLLLTTTGAKSGRPRMTPLLFFTDGNVVVVIASNGGRRHHPAWYHNLRAHPEANLFVNGHSRTYVAREATGAERDRLWNEATDLYRGYDAYQERTDGRRIPVMVLTPKG